MTAKILTVYNQIADKIEATLPGFFRIPNPYVPDSTSFEKLIKAYGIAIGPAFDTNRTVSCITTWKRSFTILIVRKVMTTDNNMAARELIETNILNDHDQLMKAFWNDLSLSNEATIASVTSDGGIRFLDGDRLKFLTMEINLDAEYQDDPRNV